MMGTLEMIEINSIEVHYLMLYLADPLYPIDYTILKENVAVAEFD
jgi:hypothetical protein